MLKYTKEFALKEPLDTCEVCTAKVPGYDIIMSGTMGAGYRRMCTSCFNASMADRMGFEDFDNSRIDPIRLVDSDGQEHEFHFTTHLFGDKLALNAFEVKDGAREGYEGIVRLTFPGKMRSHLDGDLMHETRKNPHLSALDGIKRAPLAPLLVAHLLINALT